MKVSHSMCGPHEDIDVIFGTGKHFGWHSCSQGRKQQKFSGGGQNYI